MEKRRKIRVGHVVSDKMDKTVVVEVETRKPHPLYRKVIKQITRFKAHDETNACDIGDTVRIVETRPPSKDKRWRVDSIITKAKTVEIKPSEIGVEIVAGEGQA